MNAKASRPTVYRIETPRLVVRCWEPKDARLLNDALHASWDHLRPWMPWARGEPPALEDTVALLRRWRGQFDLDQDYTYAIFNHDESQVLGSTGLHTRGGAGVREIGYWIHVDHARRGYATETSAVLTRVAFELAGIRRVEIHCLPHNVRSAAVPRKLGYVYEATLRQRLDEGDGTFGDAMIWTMLADDYPRSHAAGAELAAYDVLGRRID
jgi:RimJ/RimL family protein N-acetyltransferase